MEEPPKIENVLSTKRILPSEAAPMLENFLAAQEEEDDDDLNLPDDDIEDQADAGGWSNKNGGRGMFSPMQQNKRGSNSNDLEDILGVDEERMTRLKCVLDSLSGRRSSTDDDDNDIWARGTTPSFANMFKKSATKKAKTPGSSKRGRRVEIQNDAVSDADEAAGGATPPHSQNKQQSEKKKQQQSPQEDIDKDEESPDDSSANSSVKVKQENQSLTPKELKKKEKKEKKELKKKEKKEKKAMKKAMKKAKKEAKKEEKKRKKRERSLGGGGGDEKERGGEERSSKRQKIKDDRKN